MRTLALTCNTYVTREGKRAGAAALPRTPEGYYPSIVHTCGRTEGEKGAASGLTTPS
jgi:hypothetical protein